MDKSLFQDLVSKNKTQSIIANQYQTLTILLIFFPLIIISPDVGFRSLINIRNVVVLPAPLAPKLVTSNKTKKKMMIYLIIQNMIVLSHENSNDQQLYRFDDVLIFLFVF